MAFTAKNASQIAYSSGPSGGNNLWLYVIPEGDDITADYYFDALPGMLKGDFLFGSDGKFRYVSERPTTPVAATNSVTIDVGNVSADDTVVVNGRTYTFKATSDADDEVDVGEDAETSATNLKNAINGVDGDHTADGANADVEAGAITEGEANDYILTLSAREGGVDGNDLTLTATGTDISAGAATFSGGRDIGSTITKTINT